MLFLIVALIAGLAAGGGTAYAMVKMLGIGGGAAAEHEPKKDEKVEAGKFVPTGKVLVPLVFADGRLAGYASMEVQLEVEEAKAEFVGQRMPLLLHAINMRTYRTPMAAGPDGMLPDLEGFRKLVEASATEAFGPKVVHRVAVTGANPA